MTYIQKKNCRLCKSETLECILDLGPSPIGENFVLAEAYHANMHTLQVEQELFPLTLMRCTSCGHVQLGEVVDNSTIFTNYMYETSHDLSIDAYSDAYAEAVTSLSDVQQGGWVIDVGSHVGNLLKALSNRGMQVMGVMPFPNRAYHRQNEDYCSRQTNFDLQFAERFCAEHGKISLLTVNNYLANIDDIDIALKVAEQLLMPSGYIVIETGYLLDLIENFVIDNIFHEHMSYFLLGPLMQYLTQHQWRVVRADRIPTKGGSLRVYAQRCTCEDKRDLSVENLVNFENELMFNTEIPFIQFAETAQIRREQARELIKKRAAMGPMAAFGASTGCITMLYWLNIANYFDFIVDDNVNMHHRLSPHAHIPVMAPEILYSRMPATLVNLPWRYLHPIMQHHKKFLEKGGHIVQLLPTPLVF